MYCTTSVTMESQCRQNIFSETSWSKLQWRKIFICAAVLYFVIMRSCAIEIAKCNSALGMQSMEIPDKSLSASSSLDPELYGAANARIRLELGGGAWCPATNITTAEDEYLEIDLGGLHAITLVETQGRFAHGKGQEFVERYMLGYQRETNGLWFKYHNRRGQEIFDGNTNSHTSELREVDPLIIAKSLRLIPYSSHPKKVCLRAELFGCPWTDGLVSYDMPQGERRGSDLEFHDLTYDGNVMDNRLTGGLGQLTDGKYGESNFRVDPKNTGHRGYDWIGWKNESFATQPLEIKFRFDAVRNFSSMTLHCNNQYSRDVEVFEAVAVLFDGGLATGEGSTIRFSYKRDLRSDASRDVKVPLLHNIGRSVVVHFKFASKWILISEVQFESEPVDLNYLKNIAENTITTVTDGNNKVPGRVPGLTGQLTQTAVSQVSITQESDHTDPLLKPSRDDGLVAIIVGVLVAIVTVLLFILIVVVVVRRQKSLRLWH